MKRDGYSLRRSARRVESRVTGRQRHTSRTRWQHALTLHCCRVPSSITPPSAAALVARARILNKQLTRDFQHAAAGSCSTSSSTSSSNRTPEYTTYILLICMIISTDAQIINAPPAVVAANALPHLRNVQHHHGSIDSTGQIQPEITRNPKRKKKG